MRFDAGADLGFIMFFIAGEERGIEMVLFDQFPRFGSEVFTLTVPLDIPGMGGSGEFAFLLKLFDLEAVTGGQGAGAGRGGAFFSRVGSG